MTAHKSFPKAQRRKERGEPWCGPSRVLLCVLRLCGKLFQISIDSENLKDKNDEVANVC